MRTERLDAAVALADAATPGPWGVDANPHRVDIDDPRGTWLFRSYAPDDDGVFVQDMAPDDYAETKANAAFIAAARTELPALAELAKAIWEKVDGYQNSLAADIRDLFADYLADSERAS